MSTNHSHLKCDLLVIGAGMAGMAASLFAANRNIDVVQVGAVGEINFASGLLDVLGVHPVKTGDVWLDPWSAVSRLIEDQPQHPYAKIGPEGIRRAMEEFMAFFDQTSQPYHSLFDTNVQIPTPVGTIKTSYGIPKSMLHGAEAWSGRLPCLLVDIKGIKGFSSRQIAETLKSRWPGLRSATIEYSEQKGDLFTEPLARSLDVDQQYLKLVEAIKPHLKDEKMVGLPAMLGFYKTSRIQSSLEEALGARVFEIPTMPPTITGSRLRELFERHLPPKGVRMLYQKKVTEAVIKGERLEFLAGGYEHGLTIDADAAVIATGRFFGKGLRADRLKIREAIFDLPVVQPDSRVHWHQKDAFHPDGHAINRAGLEVDSDFRPLSQTGRAAHPMLFAAGSILAHQDWKREKSGSGLAVATALAAIEAYLKLK